MSESGAQVRLDHVGVDVADLAGAIAFYSSVFGLLEIQRTVLPDRGLVRVLLGGPWKLELFQRHGAAPGPVFDDDTQHDVLGIGHLALSYETAKDVRRMHDLAINAGAVSLMAPAALGGPEVRAYLRDPSGVLLELVERITAQSDGSLPSASTD